MMMGVGFLLFVLIRAAIFIGVPLLMGIGAVRLFRVLEGRRPSSTELAEVQSRLTRLEDSLSETNEQLARLSEGHQFLTRLLMERHQDAPLH